MTLPDLTRMAAVSTAEWRGLAKHLAGLGLTPARVEPIVSAAARVHPALRRPIRNHHLRRIEGPAGFAMRMFLFSDPVREEEARAAVGDKLDWLVEIGLLARGEGTVVSPFVMSLFNELFLLSDELTRGGDAVMGFGEGTIELCRAAFPVRAIGTALDLGCGSGTCALVLAAAAKRVIATDINPRALVMAGVNARLNGIENVELREGDLFAPLEGMEVDLIASQPPFVPLPDGSEGAVFLSGGRRGDELGLKVLSEVKRHLRPGGRAVLRVDWPEYGEERLEKRLYKAVGEGADLLLLASPGVSPEHHASGYASGIHPVLDKAFEDEATRRLAHLERSGIRAIVPCLTVVRRSSGEQSFAGRLDVVALGRAQVSGERVEALMAARDVAGDPDALLAARLRVPEGTTLAQEQVGPGAEVESTLWARFADAALVHPMPLTEELLILITAVHEADDVRSGLAAFAEMTETALEQAMAEGLPVVARALVAGLLELAAPPGQLH
ncbi:MAG: methyltransferase [Polyangiaceae bacterium]